MEYKDYYKILGVGRTATQDEVKRAYRKLARKYHPDVSKEADAEAKFKEVGEAYEVLKDPEKRAAYDQLGANWKAGQEFAPPPAGVVDLKVPAGSASGRKLRLKGRGIPGEPAGDLYAVLQLVAPPAHSEKAKALYRQMEQELAFNPRQGLGV